MITLLLVAQILSVSSIPASVIRPLSEEAICATKWGLDRRRVTEKMKREVAQKYGIPREQIVGRQRGWCCEFDHIIPRQLGGADVVENLQLQPWAIAHMKDVRENAIQNDVCAGKLTLDEARLSMWYWKP